VGLFRQHGRWNISFVKFDSALEFAGVSGMTNSILSFDANISLNLLHLFVAAGPQAACLGCAGFAAFSVAIEKIFDRHN
jgi:hypothetical protein